MSTIVTVVAVLILVGFLALMFAGTLTRKGQPAAPEEPRRRPGRDQRAGGPAFRRDALAAAEPETTPSEEEHA